jgi:hypothetical protein
VANLNTPSTTPLEVASTTFVTLESVRLDLGVGPQVHRKQRQEQTMNKAAAHFSGGQ